MSHRFQPRYVDREPLHGYWVVVDTASPDPRGHEGYHVMMRGLRSLEEAIHWVSIIDEGHTLGPLTLAPEPSYCVRGPAPAGCR